MKTDSRLHYLLISDWWLLNDWARLVLEMFGPQADLGVYLVGSALKTNKYRDVDIRLIMRDEDFDNEFPFAKEYPYPRGKLAYTNLCLSLWGQKTTGLPIDFQCQRMTEANSEFTGDRNAIGEKL